MFYSTRNKDLRMTASECVLKGLSGDGGLFLPIGFPKFNLKDVMEAADGSYADFASFILKEYLDDYEDDEIRGYCRLAYGKQWRNDRIMPLKVLASGVSVLELFHGPTCAFKDAALQIMPYLLTSAIKKSGQDSQAVILAATSGDTGKAAMEGYKDVPGTKICVFYPDKGVSDIQRLQMTSQAGENVMVFGISGNFDDAQTGVKELFTDGELALLLKDEGVKLSSANSINWGRLAPQTVYYFKAYADLVKTGRITSGDEVNICVPTGNFGNILAGYIAKKSGLPINKLICASNSNDVLTEFINTGRYNKNRGFHVTVSPSMDILVSSNLERLLFLLSGEDDELINRLMKELSDKGEYTVDDDIKDALRSEGFVGGSCNEEECLAEIKDTFENNRYLIDTHTAVAMKVYKDYINETGDKKPTVIAATASPFKFSGSILKALGQAKTSDEFSNLEKLSEITKLEIPPPLAKLKGSEPRFNTILSPSGMKESVIDWLVTK